ncbi:hypothetical protein GTX53_24320 [Streptomyces sp. SID5594]|uniref:hypothetical protein n=1 Tax=unclassified Streptomyces TaxID=2593676 RepID=UPI000381BFB9|nr:MULTISPECIES: hypothetical protein [unclassified Streptomyces]MZF56918.1 hypothetical protein [Streptomyces sp. SID5594]
MPHYLIEFTDDEPDRIIRASNIKAESREGFDVYVAYGPSRQELVIFTGAHVRSVKETVIPRKKPDATEN